MSDYEQNPINGSQPPQGDSQPNTGYTPYQQPGTYYALRLSDLYIPGILLHYPTSGPLPNAAPRRQRHHLSLRLPQRQPARRSL